MRPRDESLLLATGIAFAAFGVAVVALMVGRAVAVGFDRFLWLALVGVLPLAGGSALAVVALGSRRARLRRQRLHGYDLGVERTPEAEGAGDLVACSRLVDDPFGLRAPREPRRHPPEGAPRLVPSDRPSAAGPIALLVVTSQAGLLFWAKGWGPWPVHAGVAVIVAALAVWVWWRIAHGSAPGARIELEPSIVHPGARPLLRWRLPDGISVARLEVTLVGEETVRSGGGSTGTTAYTRRRVVPMPLLDIASPTAVGEARVAFPTGILPTFRSLCARVDWWLEVRLVVPGAPDPLDTLDLAIAICAPAAAA